MAGLYYIAMAFMLGLLGIAIAAATSITLVLRARRRLPREAAGRRAFLAACGLAPFGGLLWLLISFIIYVQISNKFAHQDCGFSGDPYVILPNGYVLGSLNTYDGYIVAPGSHTDTARTGPGYVRSLIDIELVNGNFVGTYDDGTIHRFSIDTKNRTIQASDTHIPIDFETVQTRVHVDPTSYWRLYDKYRHRWPMIIFLDLIAIGEGGIIFSLRRFRATMQRRAAQA